MNDLSFVLDGVPMTAHPGQTILQAALEQGYYIPNLCSHQDLMPAGACRMCLVEIEGREGKIASCTTPVEEGMIITSKNEELRRLRRLSLELLFSAHPEECGSCPKNFRCELAALEQYTGAVRSRMRHRMHVYPEDKRNPLFVHDFTRCILCERCVRVCGEVREVGVLKVIKEKNGDIHIGIPDGKTLAEAGCRFCGACVEVCPTGALQDRPGLIDLTKSRRVSCVPCASTCPAGIDIPEYIRLVREGRPEDALCVIREHVPFPGVLGAVCVHTCESKCRRGEVNEAVAIRELKRYAVSKDDGRWKAKSKQLPETGKKVAVIGAGPAGLTAAFYLRKQGHTVVVFESQKEAGGMLRYGIPQYRLDRGQLDKEIRQITEFGVELRCGETAPAPKELLAQGYDAVVLTTGTHASNVLQMDGRDLEGVLLNIPFLHDAADGHPQPVGKRVVVLGGGNVAVDCAGTALRLGAEKVTLLCLESRDAMTAGDEELKELLEEGAEVINSVSFRTILGENGKVTGIDCAKVASFRFENGTAVIELVPDSEFVEEADTVIFAVGQHPDLPDTYELPLERGRVACEGHAVREMQGVFAAGDCVTGTRSVIEAISGGRETAAEADRYLGGDGDISEQLMEREEHCPALGRKTDFADLRRAVAACMTPEERKTVFSLITKGFCEEEACGESQRCLQCDLRPELAGVRFWNDYASETGGSAQ